MLHAHNTSSLLRNENKASLRPIDMHARAFVASENNLMSSQRREGRKTLTVGNKWSSSSGSRFYANVVQRCSSGAGHEPRHSRSFISRVPSGERALLSRTPSNEKFDCRDQESLEVREKPRSRSSMRPHVHRALLATIKINSCAFIKQRLPYKSLQGEEYGSLRGEE